MEDIVILNKLKEVDDAISMSEDSQFYIISYIKQLPDSMDLLHAITRFENNLQAKGLRHFKILPELSTATEVVICANETNKHWHSQLGKKVKEYYGIPQEYLNKNNRLLKFEPGKKS